MSVHQPTSHGSHNEDETDLERAVRLRREARGVPLSMEPGDVARRGLERGALEIGTGTEAITTRGAARAGQELLSTEPEAVRLRAEAREAGPPEPRAEGEFPAVGFQPGPAVQKASASIDDLAVQREAVLSEDVPPALEPLEQDRLNLLIDTLLGVTADLGDGDVAVDVPTVSGDQAEVPPGLFSRLQGLAAFIRTAAEQIPGLADLMFDPVEASTSNMGIVDMATKLDQLVSDPTTVRSLRNLTIESGAAEAQPETQAPSRQERMSALEQSMGPQR